MPAQWMCETCSKFFQRKGDLKRHEKLHTGEKPHICVDCGKSFAQYTGLKTHRNVHTGAKPHECNVCQARFGDPSSCARHKRETHMHPEGYQCFADGCRTKIKRRSAFVKHVKAKHGIDMTKMSIEDAAVAADMIKPPPDVGQAATPPPDYTAAAKQRRYQEEDLPSFPSDAIPKEEVYTPPPAALDVIPLGGFRWPSADFIDHTTLGTEVNCFLYSHISQPPAYYDPSWTGTPIPVHSAAPPGIYNSSPSPCASGTDYNFAYDPNTCGDFNSQLSSLRDATDMHTYVTPAHMTSLPAYHFA